jgi:hypothetical protein
MALRDLDLRSNDVDTRDHFGDGVLHLDARIHFDEIPGAGFGIDQKFDSAGVIVIRGSGERHGCIGNCIANGGGERNGGRDFDHFLIAALNRTIALIKMQGVAVTIGQDLNFDVTGTADVAFEEDRVVAEGRPGFLAGFLEFLIELVGVFDHAHASAAASERGLDDEREADARGLGVGRVEIGNGMLRSRDDGNSGRDGEIAGGGFVAEQIENIGTGADEGDAGLFASARQRRIFGEESVSGMNRVDSIFESQRDGAIDVEVGLHGSLALADEIGFIGFEAMQAEAVLLGVDGDGAQAEFVGGAKDGIAISPRLRARSFFMG